MKLYPLKDDDNDIDIHMTAISFQLNNFILMKCNNQHLEKEEEQEEQEKVMNENVKEEVIGNWCSILGLPFEFNVKKLEDFIEPFLPDIISYCILFIETNFDATNEINIPKPDRCVLIQFVNVDVLTLFVELYNNLQFSPQLLTAPCIVIPLTSIQIMKETIESKEHDTMIPLPTCAICIRRLRSDTSRIQGIKEISVAMKYFGNEDRCKVCATYTFSDNLQNQSTNNTSLSCMDCPVMHNIWTCLICSHRGCGRYTSRHAQIHFEQTGHSFSLELATGRIWDYAQDTFVHEEGMNFNQEIFGRNLGSNNNNNISNNHNFETEISQKGNLLIPSTKTGENNDIESSLDPEIVDKLSIIHIEFEALLEGQLAEQQLYFEKQYAQETWTAIESTTGHHSDIIKDSSSLTLPYATEGQLDALESMKIEISAIEADHQEILNITKEVQREIRKQKKSNDSLIREQKAMKEHIKQLNIREEEITRERNERVADLRQQIVDLTVYMNTQGQIQSSPLRDEIIGGTIQTVVPPPIPDHKKKKKK